MKGKYRSLVKFAGAWLKREYLRWQLRDVVAWQPFEESRPGCTVVIGMCSRLPDVLAANLRCLAASRWPELRAIIVAVDSIRTDALSNLEAAARNRFPDLPVEFVYYSVSQSSLAEKLKLPYVYSWLSWCLAISRVATEHFFIHDYDALILGPQLGVRHEEFRRSGVKVQGIRWYDVNGFSADDRLCTTFEMFSDTRWFRSRPPLRHFNKVGVRAGRSVDYDTTLWAQASLPDTDKAVMEMDADQLVHPSQMIHQYTMFRRHGPLPLPCFSMPMIPFFSALGGDGTAMARAAKALSSAPPSCVDLFGDGCLLNLALLDVAQVDWALKQMAQASVRTESPPSRDLYTYGDALYEVVGAPQGARWIGDFTAAQRAWIARSAGASPAPA